MGTAENVSYKDQRIARRHLAMKSLQHAPEESSTHCLTASSLARDQEFGELANRVGYEKQLI